MRRPIRTVPLHTIAIVLTLMAPARAQAQAPDVLSALQPSGSALAMEAAAPLPERLVPPAPLDAAGEGVAALETRDVRRRSPWKYPLIGLAVGAVVGAGVGTCVMLDSDEWLAPPAHILTVPAGAVLGFAIGGAMNLIDPR